MAHRATFNATFRCGNMLQVFESDSNTGNIVAWIYNVALKTVSWQNQILLFETIAVTKTLPDMFISGSVTLDHV
jgi:hypothetical protein